MSRRRAWLARPRDVALALLGTALLFVGCDLNPRPEDPSSSKGLGPDLGADSSGGGTFNAAGGGTSSGAGAGMSGPDRYGPPLLSAARTDQVGDASATGTGGYPNAPGADAAAADGAPAPDGGEASTPLED
jgi:hypothetical protein